MRFNARKARIPLSLVCVALLAGLALAPRAADARTVADALGRDVEIPARVERVICSGPGCLRLLTYLRSQDMIAGVDDIETRRRMFDARPYALANPQFKKFPVFGGFRGFDDPERILTLEPQPQVILKTYPTMGHDPVELQAKTGIPVVTMNYGDLGAHRKDFYQAVRIMAQVAGKVERGEELIAFFDGHIAELAARTKDIPQDKRPTAFVGGVAHKGPHGYQSTEPGYPPFKFAGINNPAHTAGLKGKDLAHSDVAKEKIVEWNPDILFLDLSTLQIGEGAGGLYELKTDPAYRTLTAVKNNKVYGLLPYNWYSRNFGSILANAYFVGKTAYPDRFRDVDPAAKADEIYAFLVGEPEFARMNELFGGLAFQPVPVD
ncbi:iron ABC transporter substrate-binding protein [Desulfocurvus sp. DL9XJH121]